MVIVLMGYMGSGKSIVGRSLAKILGYNFIDLDDYIEEKEEYSVSEIFKTKGEIYFRKIESKYLQEILSLHSDTVLSLGGGTPCYGNNIHYILNTEFVISFYLKTSIPQLYDRLYNEKETRPMISHLNTKEALIEFIGKHLFERTQYYTLSNTTINTDNKSVDEIVESIVLKLV